MMWRSLFIPTLRQTPADTGAVSHQLLLRAGYIRQLGPGIYSHLLLAQRSLSKIAQIIRDEMTAVGAQEMQLPIMHPADRKLYPPSRERAVIDIARGELRSYKQLPQIWYEFHTRFSDEPRPSLGLLQPRQSFEMDAYALDTDAGALQSCYRKYYHACSNILSRCGLRYLVTTNDECQTFLVLSESGVEPIVRCEKCGSVQKRERARASAPVPSIADPDGDLSPEPFHTPDLTTIASIARLTGLPETSQIKSMVMVAESRPVLVLLRGDHSLSELKLGTVLKTTDFRQAYWDEIRNWFGAEAGSLGPVGVKNIRIIADEALKERRNMIAGANRTDYHLRNVTPAEDFDADYFDLREIVPGDLCNTCNDSLEQVGGIEVAGGRIPAKCDLSILNEAGLEVQAMMGSFSIGIEKLLCAAVDQFHDHDGIIIPLSIAPFDVVVTPVSSADEVLRRAAGEIYDNCCAAGLDTLADDREERPGVKFKDADLIGIPYRIIIGKKISQGIVEVFERKTKTSTDVDKTNAAALLAERIKKSRSGATN